MAAEHDEYRGSNRAKRTFNSEPPSERRDIPCFAAGLKESISSHEKKGAPAQAKRNEVFCDPGGRD